MNAYIELRGGKLVAVYKKERKEEDKDDKDDKEEYTDVTHMKHLMPGDVVSIPSFELIERIEQPGIAIVYQSHQSNSGKIHTLYIATIPPCSFAPSIEGEEGEYKKGDRLVVWFHKTGQIEVKGIYSLDAKDDKNCLLHMYSLVKERQPLIYEYENTSFYTEEERDETHLDTFTIDPEHSVDFDDAISVDIENKTLYVHIVDIAHSNITKKEDDNLRERCFTLYLSNEHVEHLLDKNNASNRLSLIVGEKRKTITIRAILDEEGSVTSYSIYPSTICVKRRYTYEGASELLAQEPFSFLVKLSRLRSKDIKYHVQMPTLRYHVKEDGYIDDIRLECMDDSHELVATAMILTNVIVSTHLNRLNVSLPNRFHDTIFGIKPLNEWSTGNVYVDSFITIKRFARACYALDERGHFGLGVKDYVHFTSPMRRYADVIVHRILAGMKYSDQSLEDEIKWINRQSMMIKTIQNVYNTWKIHRHLLTIPNEYEVWVTSVSKNGVMWYMPSYSLNGYTHISNIFPKQFWLYNDGILKGKKNEINVGKKCKGIIIDRDPLKFTISLRIVSE